jgi:hypothetical protein
VSATFPEQAVQVATMTSVRSIWRLQLAFMVVVGIGLLAGLSGSKPVLAVFGIALVVFGGILALNETRWPTERGPKAQ